MKVQKNTLNIIPFLQWKDEGIFRLWELQSARSGVFGFVNQEKVRVGSASLVSGNVQRKEGDMIDGY